LSLSLSHLAHPSLLASALLAPNFEAECCCHRGDMEINVGDYRTPHCNKHFSLAGRANGCQATAFCVIMGDSLDFLAWLGVFLCMCVWCVNGLPLSCIVIL